jgi:hypothetical protein
MNSTARVLERAPAPAARNTAADAAGLVSAPSPCPLPAAAPAGNLAAAMSPGIAPTAAAPPASRGGNGVPPMSAQSTIGNAAMSGVVSADAEAPAPAGAIRLVRPRPPSVSAADAPIATLRTALPSASLQALTSAETQTQGLLAGEQQRLAANPPTMQAPSGLPAAPLSAPSEQSSAEMSGGGGTEAAAAVPPAALSPLVAPIPEPAEVEIASELSDAADSVVAAASASDEEGVAAVIFAPIDVRRLLAQSGSVEDVDTGAGERPTIALTEDIDPAQAETAAAPRDAATVDAESRAAAERAVDPGVDAIRPSVEPRLVSGMVGAVTPAAMEEPLVPEAISDEVARGFDQAAAGSWAEVTAHASADHDAAFSERTAGEAREWAGADAKIAAAEQEATAQQQTAIGTARGEAASANEAWSVEIAAARGTYQTSRTTSLQTLDHDVEARRLQGEQQAACQLNEGERQANEIKVAKQREVEAERARVERESEESDGFFGWLASKVEDLFDALADFINKAFNWLRSQVAKLIDAAKRLARKAIDLARRAINGLIRLAADALELAANVFLALFPKARDRAKAWIRGARDTAINAVNSAADWLAKRVDQLLDALGTALDFILSVYQRAYLAILNAIRFLVVGFVKIMRNIARLVDAARAMPTYFEGEVEAELIGQDLTQPLFFERSGSATGPDAKGAMPEAAMAAVPVTADADLAVLGQDRLSDEQAAVDSVADFTPHPMFFRQLQLRDGGEIIIEGSEGPEATVEAHLGHALNTAPEGASPDGAAAAAGSVDGIGTEGTAAALVDGRDTETRLTDLMKADPEGACDAKSAPTGTQSFPESKKFGPLTRGQRARYLLSQMRKGIRQWFSCNWPWVLAAAVGALLGIILLEIVTGGAITAALPVLLEILAAVMIGAAVVKASGHVLDYLAKAWDGDIQGGGRSLGKGLAVGAVELIFAILTYITAGAFRALAAGARATGRLARSAARGAVRLGRAAATATRTGLRRVGQLGRRLLQSGGRLGRVGGTVLVRGRLVFRGLRRGFARGVRSLDELAERLRGYFRFRRFKITRRGHWFQLWGYLNPWILVAQDRLEWVDEIVETGGRRARIGEEVVGRTQAGAEVRGRLLGGTRAEPPYRTAYEVHHGEDIGEDWIHHLIERQAQEKLLPQVFRVGEIHAPANLRRIAAGIFNRVVHLSRIRVMWNRIYNELARLGANPAVIRRAFTRYARYTDEFIEAMNTFARTNQAYLRAVAAGDRALERRLLEDAANAWMSGARAPATVVNDVIREALESL